MPLPQNCSSSPASVARIPPDQPTWRKVLGDEPLAQLHAKFWGKNLAEEERAWRDSQPRANILGEDAGQLGASMDIDQNEVNNVGGTDEGYEVSSGCFVLDLGVEGLEVSKIWIRRDYQRIYHCLEEYYNRPSLIQRAPAAVITGQPGIGKSCFVYYALPRRLSEKKPVIWYFEGTRYLFVDDGVYEVPHNFPSAYFKTFIWTLVDADEASDGVPPHLIRHNTRHYVIYTTSPCSDRWSRLYTTSRTIVVVMNPWTRAEILQAASALYPGILDDESLNNTFDRLGPTPRLCFDISLQPQALSRYEQGLTNAIREVDPSRLVSLVRNAGALDMDVTSHKLCLVRREQVEDVYSRPIVAPITAFIQSRVAKQLREVQPLAYVHVRACESAVPGFERRAVSSFVFEALAQQLLRDRAHLELVPMVKLDSPRTGGQLPKWYSSHQPLPNPVLESCRQRALKEVQKIDFEPIRVEKFTKDELTSIRQKIFYEPSPCCYEAPGPFILLDNLLLIFQFATIESHGIKPGLREFFGRVGDLPPMSEWLVVFIIPPNLTFTCPQTRCLELRDLPLYSAVPRIKGWEAV